MAKRAANGGDAARLQDTRSKHWIVAPFGTPRPILNQISKEIARILALPDINEWLHSIGYVPAPNKPEEFDRLLRGQIEVMSKLVVDIGLRAK